MRKSEIIILALFLLLAIALSLALSIQPKEEDTKGIQNNISRETELKNFGDLGEPLPNSRSRVTKKPFGIYVESGKSPVPNERFMGYHTGTDFEILENEQESRISVYAICSGESIYRRVVSGYGGVIVQDCRIEDKPVTVLYGHLDLEGATTATIAQGVGKGAEIGVLGKVGRYTDNERRHLHLGIHLGPDIDLRGYVEDERELSAWLNYLDLIK